MPVSLPNKHLKVLVIKGISEHVNALKYLCIMLYKQEESDVVTTYQASNTLAACDNSFWTTSFGIIIGSGVVLSFLVAHLGALIGRRRGSQGKD